MEVIPSYPEIILKLSRSYPEVIPSYPEAEKCGEQIGAEGEGGGEMVEDTKRGAGEITHPKTCLLPEELNSIS